ncbi:MAG: diacylglycerol kinase family protein, partial [Opitutales bacterium]
MAFSIRQRLQSFRHAFRGLKFLAVSQHNAWLHAAATVLVIAFGLIFRVTRADWLWLILAIALVWIAEAFNTALESLADEISREHRARLGRAKDLAAAAVLLASIAAALIGLLI